MYAVIETGGQQHRVSPGDVIQVQKIGQDDGGEIHLDKVLLVSRDDDTVLFGKPYIENASVKAEIKGGKKSRKVLVFKKKPRKGHRKLNGHRQNYTVLEIKDIVLGG